MKQTILGIILNVIILTGVHAQSCLPDGIHFTDQSQIDNFQSNYPGCTEIGGSLSISGNGIKNLSGLSVVNAIEGDLWIDNNDFLASLSGLHNLLAIGGGLHLAGLDGLANLTGLNKLRSIGDMLEISFNDKLANLTGLDSLGLVEGVILIHTNAVLINLFGLENISAESIDHIEIYYNPALSQCEATSICVFLTSIGGNASIQNNAPGCNSQLEIEESCLLGVDETFLDEEVLIYPNPAGKEISLVLKNGEKVSNVKIYDQVGHVVLSKVSNNNLLDVSAIGSGLYIVEIVIGKKLIRKKLLIE
jgi:Secretion system C-terminal sorting domain